MLSRFTVPDSTDHELKALKAKFSGFLVECGKQIIAVFESGIDETGSLREGQSQTLAGCCLVANVIPDDHRSALIKCYLDKQFQAYRKLFPASLQVNELKSLPNRFSWCKRVLTGFERVYAHIFPEDWQVDILLCQAIGNWIKEDISSICASVPEDRRVSDDLFMQAFTAANSFDRFLTLKYRNRFTSRVAQAFQDYHFFLFEAKEDEFFKLKDKLLPKDCVKSINKVLKRDQMILANFDQIFLFFSDTLDTLSGLSSNILMVQMSFFLSDCIEVLNTYLMDQIKLIKKKIIKKWTEDLGRVACAIVNTIDYCISNVNDQLERLLSLVMVNDLRQHISLQAVQDKLVATLEDASACLKSRFESDLDILFGRFRSTVWPSNYTPVDPSPFLNQMLQYYGNQTRFGLIQVCQHLQPQTCIAFLESYLASFFARLQDTVLSLKGVTESVSEQLLIDLFGLRNFFSQVLPPTSWTSKDSEKWAQIVTKQSVDYESLVKVLLTPIEPISPFIQSYLLLLTNCSAEMFSRVLTVKGRSKASEQQIYFDELAKHVPPTPSGEELVRRPSSSNQGSAWSLKDGLLNKLKDLSISKLSRSSVDADSNNSPVVVQGSDEVSSERGL